MNTVIIIPARYASTRYPGKPLAMLKGAFGKNMTLIERSWRAAKEVKGAQRVVVATDDERIKDEVERFGAEVIITSEHCKNGTERCAEAADKLGNEYDIVVNFQGDAPLTPPWFVEDLINALKEKPDFHVATPVLRCDVAMVNDLLEDRRNSLVGGTTAVFSKDFSALYFSKEVIPFMSEQRLKSNEGFVYHHVGVYAYQKKILSRYVDWGSSNLEISEGLEQLRFIENNKKILCVEVSAKGRKFWELNNPEDIGKIENFMLEMGLN